MIYKTKGQEFHCGNSSFIIGEEVVGTDRSEYEYLIGYITEIRDGEDKDTENETPDIYCTFEPPISPYDIKHLESVFSELYETPKTIDDITLDEVIMAPEMVIPTRMLSGTGAVVPVYIVHQEWANDGEDGTTIDIFLDYMSAKRQFFKLLKEDSENGLISEWSKYESFICESYKDSYVAYIDGEYLFDRYRVVIEKLMIPVNDEIMRKLTNHS